MNHLTCHMYHEMISHWSLRSSLPKYSGIPTPHRSYHGRFWSYRWSFL